MSSEKANQVAPVRAPTSTTSISLGKVTSLDLSGLPEDQQQQLLRDHMAGLLDIDRKANELGVEAQALRANLMSLAETTKQVAGDGNSVTIAHTHNTSNSRTEMKIGNTEDARAGRMSRSQTGERDFTPYYIIAGIIAVALVAIAIFGGR